MDEILHPLQLQKVKMMNDFNTKTLLKPKATASKQMLALRDGRSLPARAMYQQSPADSYKEALQLKPRKSEQMATTKTMLKLRPSLCDSVEDTSSKGSFRSRPGSPHSISSGYATEELEYHSDQHSHDGDSNTHHLLSADVYSECLKDYCEYCFSLCVHRSRMQREPMPRCQANGPWKSHLMLDQNGLVACPVLYSRVCGVCGATGGNAHIVEHCPLRRFHFLNLG